MCTDFVKQKKGSLDLKFTKNPKLKINQFCFLLVKAEIRVVYTVRMSCR